MSSRRSSAAARQSVKGDYLASYPLTYTCQLSVRRRLFQLCVFCLRNTQMLYLAPSILAVTEERLDASDQLLHQAFDVVASNVATLLAAWCAGVFSRCQECWPFCRMSVYLVSLGCFLPRMCRGVFSGAILLAVYMSDSRATFFFGMLSPFDIHWCFSGAMFLAFFMQDSTITQRS